MQIPEMRAHRPTVQPCSVAALVVALALTTAVGCRSLPHTPLPGLNQPGGAATDGSALETAGAVEEPRELVDVTYAGFEAALTAAQLERLRGRAPLAPGAPLTQQDVQATAELALARLQEAGYPYARVSIEEDRVAPDAVRLIVRADPGELAFFGRIDIAGNLRVDDGVIRRYLAFRPGERFRVSPVRESHRRLAALGLFESVDIEVVDEDAAPLEIPIRVIVKERDPRALDFSFGYATEEQLSGEVEWRDLNFLGGARRLSVLSRWSWIDRGVGSTFVEPYLGRPDLSLAVSGQAWFRDERLFNVLALGGGATLAHQLAPHDVVSVTYTHRFERSRVTGFALDDPGRREQLALIGLNASERTQEGVLSALGVQLMRDTRDAPIDARRGYLGSIGVAQAGGPLPGRFTYREATVTGHHHSTHGIVTLVQRASYGSSGSTGDSPGVPFFRRYFMGGADNIRGWGRHEVGPLSQTGAPLGGQAYFWASSEMRLAVAGPLGAAVFLDAGNSWLRPWTLRVDDLRYGAGVGVRYRSPFGPVRIDVGYQLDPIPGLRIGGEPQERRWRVHVSAGQ